MEHLVFIAIVIALIEFKEFKQNRRYKAIQQGVEILRVSMEVQISKQGMHTEQAISALRSEITPLAEFLTKAQTDLSTIVQEYEVNGVPLGYQRGNNQKFDLVEGL